MKSFKRFEQIYKAGDAADYLYLVKEGEIEVKLDGFNY